MLGLLFAVLPLVSVYDRQSGRPLPVNAVITRSVDGTTYDISADGSALHDTSFHGTFPTGRLPSIVRISALTSAERRAIDRVNVLRREYQVAPLQADENLTETARYWAREERIAGRVGHTCAALGNPKGCVEFNAFFHQLPGAPGDWFCGQNAAFDTISDWLGPEIGFENERFARSGERGHFLNLIQATRWIGLGETTVPGVGAYFAMNVM